MTEINNKILDMIKEGKSIEEISNFVNLSYKQIFNRISSLQNNGYYINRNYYTDGNITYTLNKDNCYIDDNEFNLINDKKFVRMIVISDLHIGSFQSDEEAINTIYDYCIKNGINVIIMCGDLINGTRPKENNIIDSENQVEYFIKNYPFDKNIINLYVKGDHDKSLYTNFKQSLSLAVYKRRHDLCSITKKDIYSNNNVISINNNKIAVAHEQDKCDSASNLDDIKLQIYGHLHISKNIFNVNKNSAPRIFIPALCRLSNDGQMNIPRAVELQLYLNNKYELEVVNKKDLIILNNKVLLDGETLINYTDEEIRPNYGFRKNTKKENITKDSKNQKYEDDKKSELGELSEESKKKLLDFYGTSRSDRKINNMLKKAKPPKKHSYK